VFAYLSKLKIFILINSLLLTACDKKPVEATEKPPVYTTEDVVLEKYNWRDKVPNSSRVKVINHYGNISSRNTSLAEVELSGVIQTVGPYAPKPQFDVTQLNGVTVIEVVYNQNVIDKYGNRIGRTDLGVYVPKGVILTLETHFGDIKAKKHASNINAKTTTGNIKLMTKGVVDAQSDSGDIKLTMMAYKKEPWLSKHKKRTHKLKTQTGHISIYPHNQSGYQVSLNAQKPIKTDNEQLAAKVVHKRDRFWLETQLLTGGDIISAISQDGEITLQHHKISSSTKPSVFTGSLTDLPESSSWKPGDPVEEVNERVTIKNKLNEAKQ